MQQRCRYQVNSTHRSSPLGNNRILQYLPAFCIFGHVGRGPALVILGVRHSACIQQELDAVEMVVACSEVEGCHSMPDIRDFNVLQGRSNQHFEFCNLAHAGRFVHGRRAHSSERTHLFGAVQITRRSVSIHTSRTQDVCTAWRKEETMRNVSIFVHGYSE